VPTASRPTTSLPTSLPTTSLLDAGAFMASVVSACADAVVGLDADDVIRIWNPAAERLFGYAEDEILGRPFRILVPADRTDELERIIARVYAGETVTCETVRLARDGRPVHVRLTGTPIRDAGGRIVGRVSTLADISARLQADAERRVVEERLALARRARRTATGTGTSRPAPPS
jgi:PAS domain S-box-containing protein